MTTKRLVPIAVALTLALGAFPAAAKHRSPDRPEVKLMRLAHELHEAASEVYAGAFESRRHRGFRHRRAVFALRNLDRDARRFHRTVEREGPYDRDTRWAFRRLERSYDTAQHSSPKLRGMRRLHRDFSRVDRLMHRIDTRLVRYDDRHHRNAHRRHSRHDRWRDRDRNDDGHGRWHVSWDFDF